MKQKSQNNRNHQIWRKYQVPDTKPMRIEIGPLILWFMKENKELRIAWKRITEATESGTTLLPEKLDWQRWAIKQKNPNIMIEPVFPDRPIVINPENSFKVTEDASVRLYARVPVWLRITLTGKPATLLIEIPIITLSSTWFGSFQEGDLCYWISSGVRMKIEPDLTRPYLAICPLELVDRATQDLNVEKICLRVEYLSLYDENGQLWSGDTTLIYRGETEVSEVKYKPVAPKDLNNAILIKEPRTPLNKSITARTFSTFKDLPGFGLLIKG